MHEQHKIQEAYYFLIRADESGENSREFSYNISAFLTAARSVRQYTLEEAKTKPNGQAWYEASIFEANVVKFLKDKRNINVHESPIVPNRRINITLHDQVVIEDSVHVTIRHADGTIEDESPPVLGLSIPALPSGETISSVSYYFSDWQGNEDVMEICIDYINAIQTIVKSGQDLGYIT